MQLGIPLQMPVSIGSDGCRSHSDLDTQPRRSRTGPQHLLRNRYLRSVGAAYQRFEANRSAADADGAERRVSVAELAAGGSGDRQAPGEGLVAAMAAVPSLYFQEHFSLSRRAQLTSRCAVGSSCLSSLPEQLFCGSSPARVKPDFITYELYDCQSCWLGAQHRTPESDVCRK